MDELIRQGQWWWLLIPLGTGILALTGSWVGAKLGQRTEHQQWLRNQKMETYASYLNATTALHDALQGRAHKNKAALKECFGVLTSGSAEFVAPAKVEALIQEFSAHYLLYMYELAVQRTDAEQNSSIPPAPTAKSLEEATAKLRKAMRADLGIKS